MKRDRKEMERDDKGMKKERGNGTWGNHCGGRMFIASVMAAMVLCMGCSGEDRAADGTNSEVSTEAMGTTEQPEEAAQQETPDGAETAEAEGSEVTEAAETEAEVEGQEAAEAAEQEAGLGESAETEVTEDADELTALYNEYKEQGVIDFTLALSEAGYDQICLVGGNAQSTTYFSVKDGNHYTIPEGRSNAVLYVPYIPTKYSCDNENIGMWYYATSDDDFLKNNIQIECIDFEGDDVPVNISVTFEDGSTQEITVYLTRHAE